MNQPTKRHSLVAASALGAIILLFGLVLLLGDVRPAAGLAEPPAITLPPAASATGTPEPATVAAQRARAAAAPDLAIHSLTLSPASPAPGQPATITVVIKNVGDTMLWDGFYTYLYIDPPQRPPTVTTPDTNYVGWFLGLAPGATFSWSYTDHTFDTAGCNHVIYAWADRDNGVGEADEGNNVAKLDVCVGGGTSGDAYEPDDACTSATILRTDGTTQDHTFAPVGDVDWYQFTGIGGAEYIITARNEGANADAALSIFNRCNLPASFGGSREIRVTLPASGTYYVKAVNHNASAASDTGYKISITSPYDCSGFYEPNDSRATAQEIPSDGVPQAHRFCAPNDEDWIKFTVRAGVRYTVRATSTGAGANPVLVGSYGVAGGASLRGNPVEFTAASDATYYVQATNQPPTAFGPTTGYTLAVIGGACTPDAFEPDNTQADAKPAVINGNPDARTACPSGDRDWIRLNFTAGVTYTLETIPIGAASDTILCLFDNIGTQIACDDEGGTNHGSRITWQATANGVYFAEIRQADSTTAGPSTAYEFSIVTGLCKPDLYEPDNAADQAQLLPTDGSRQTRNFCASGDSDWIKLNIPAAGSYIIQTSGLAIGSDTQLVLYRDQQTTALTSNDDYGPGLASQIVYSFPAAGIYYVQVKPFNPGRYGRSTSYLLSAAPGTPTPTPTPGTGTPTPRPTATATPPPSGIQTLILTNRERLTAIYGAPRVAPIFNKLTAFANHPAVMGEIIQVDGNGTVAAAYANWLVASTEITKTNEVASAVRAVALAYLAAHPSVQYVVLIGDDRVIPARRIKDRTSFPESQYPSISSDTPVGAALAADYFLTDDYYVDREPTLWQGAELYIPDWAIGRLVETPEEISGMLDAFIATSELAVGRSLVVGYDFVQDVATNICELFGRDIGNANLDCTLISDSWSGTQFRDKQLRAVPPFKLQSINGHASHAGQGAPVGGQVSARDVVSSTADLGGGLIYSVGCHAGLNVPETSSFPLDLPQAFAVKRTNYIGNTGFGWGSRIGVYLSERLMQNFSQELLKGTSAAVGKALLTAKQRYYLEADGFEERDEKVLQQATLYGFPMFRVNTGAVLSDDDPFPSVTISSPFGGGRGAQASSVGLVPATADQAGKGPVRIHVGTSGNQADSSVVSPQGFTRTETIWGSYFRLDGHTNSQSSGPILPQFFAELQPPAGQRLRGAVFTGGAYITQTVDPAINAALNEYVPAATEPAFVALGAYPAVPFVLRSSDTISRTGAALTVVMGQHDVTTGEQRLFTDLQYDVYFSALGDQTGPTITWIDGFYNTRTEQATFKVEATDSLTVTRVLIAYSTGAGSWLSFDLAYNDSTHKWSGAQPGVRGAQYYVQAVDSAGNATAVTRKGGYFRLEDAEALAAQPRRAYLPVVLKR